MTAVEDETDTNQKGAARLQPLSYCNFTMLRQALSSSPQRTHPPLNRHANFTCTSRAMVY